MERNNLIKKGLAVAVIILFIGLAFAPSINANVDKVSVDNKLVEITTEVCGLKGEKHTVSLSKEDALEVEQLIDDIERRLDEIETREETIEIFNDALVELDKYGLLGGLSVKQAQKLVTGGYFYSKLMKHIERRYNTNWKEIDETDNISNTYCLVASHVKQGAILADFGLLFIFILLPLAMGCYPDPPPWLADLIRYHFIKPFRFMHFILIIRGSQIANLFTIGSHGIKYSDYTTDFLVRGFFGIKITYSFSSNWKAFYFGFAFETLK